MPIYKVNLENGNRKTTMAKALASWYRRRAPLQGLVDSPGFQSVSLLAPYCELLGLAWISSLGDILLLFTKDRTRHVRCKMILHVLELLFTKYLIDYQFCKGERDHRTSFLISLSTSEP